MAIAFQGFALRKNLEESELDIDAINNLGGTPIADDLALFVNNNRNTSSLTIFPSYVNGTVITVPGDSYAVFTNRTQVTVNSEILYIKNSNGIDTFEFTTRDTPPYSSADTVTPNFGSNTSLELVRSDAITPENLSNFSLPRRNTNIDRTDDETQLGFLNSSRTGLLSTSSNSIAALDTLEANLDFFNFKKQKAIIKDRTFVGRKVLYSNGCIIIKDPDNLNTAGLADSNPGLFIRDPVGGANIRAFSSSENPWIETPGTGDVLYGDDGFLASRSVEVTAGTLLVDNPGYGVDFILKASDIVTTLSTSQLSGIISSNANTTTITNISSTADLTSGMTLVRVSGSGAFGGVTTITKIDNANTITIRSTTANTAGAITFSQSYSNQNFTHKLPVTVNGEVYYLCLKQ